MNVNDNVAANAVQGLLMEYCDVKKGGVAHHIARACKDQLSGIRRFVATKATPTTAIRKKRKKPTRARHVASSLQRAPRSPHNLKDVNTESAATLNRLWNVYFNASLKNGAPDPATLATMELLGATVTVVRSKDLGAVQQKGVIIHESPEAFVLLVSCGGGGGGGGGEEEGRCAAKRVTIRKQHSEVELLPQPPTLVRCVLSPECLLRRG